MWSALLYPTQPLPTVCAKVSWLYLWRDFSSLSSKARIMKIKALPDGHNGRPAAIVAVTLTVLPRSWGERMIWWRPWWIVVYVGLVARVVASGGYPGGKR